MNQFPRDEMYRELLLAPLRICAGYLPKMGRAIEVDLATFHSIYSVDPLYHWMGLDSDLMFAAHKAAGGMTSVYRQLGIGCERLFREMLKDQLHLRDDQVKWSYEVLVENYQDLDNMHALPMGDSKKRILTLDGRVDIGDIPDPDARRRMSEWIDAQKEILNITASIKGAVFEVRQGYKSADSKRQNADLSNAAQALGHGYLPTLVIMSTQINAVVHSRYQLGNWAVLLGAVRANDSLKSTYDFARQVVGFDLSNFFERNSPILRAEVESVLRGLLEAR